MNMRYFSIFLAIFLVMLIGVGHATAGEDQTVTVDGKSVVIASWICAAHKTEIPAEFYVAEVDTDLNFCEYPKQHVLIREINYATFWMCNFDDMGVPAGYELTRTGTTMTCGCREVAKAPNGKAYCATVGARDFLGWPMLAVSKHYGRR